MFLLQSEQYGGRRKKKEGDRYWLSVLMDSNGTAEVLIAIGLKPQYCIGTKINLPSIAHRLLTLSDNAFYQNTPLTVSTLT